MGALIDCEDHLPIHVLEVRPEDIQRNVVFIVLAHYLADHGEGFVAPAALMMSETPKRRNVASADIFMVALEDFFWVGLTEEDYEVQRSANGVIHEFIGVLPRFNKKAIGILEVSEMIELALPLTCKIKRMMPVSLLTDAISSFVNLPRFVPVPNRPFSITHMEVLLEALTESPFHRLVIHCKPVMIVLED